MAAPQKHRACNRPGRPLCDKACNRIRAGVLQQTLPATSLLNTTVLYTEVRDQGLQQRGGTATNPYFEALPNLHPYLCPYLYLHWYLQSVLIRYISIAISVYPYVDLHLYVHRQNVYLYPYLYTFLYLHICIHIHPISAYKMRMSICSI